MRIKLIFLIPLLLLTAILLTAIAHAQPTPVGSELEVNTVTTGAQASSEVASDDQGNLIVVWQGPDQDSNGIFAQRHAADGSPLGGEFQVNTTTMNSQHDPVVSSSAQGDFVVVWANQIGAPSRATRPRPRSPALLMVTSSSPGRASMPMARASAANC